MKTDRLTIRRITADDWKSIQRIWVDFHASPLSRYDRPCDTGDEAVRARIQKWAEANSGTDHMFFAVCLRGEMIGYISMHVRENGHEIGYCFHSAYHGKGYAKESLSKLFTDLRALGITRFSAGTAMRNTPSVALLKALGFSLTGTENVSFYKDSQGNDIVFEGGIFELNM